MIRTNQFRVHWDLENVDRDFDIFKIKKDKRLYNSNVLDLPSGSVKALAVQYTFGSTCLVLFRKGEMSAARLCRAISSEYGDVTVEKINVMDKKACEDNFYYQYRLLAQLLMNSMRTAYLEDSAYNNLSGRLFYAARGWKSIDKDTKKPYAFKTLEMTFDPGMFLNANVKTFRALASGKNDTSGTVDAAADKASAKWNTGKKTEKGSGRPGYIFDSETKGLRRRLNTDKTPDDSVFEERSFKGRRNTVPFIRFNSLRGFNTSKAGVIYGFLKDTNRELGGYFVLEQVCRSDDRTYAGAAMLGDGKQAANWASILNERGVNITDECHTVGSQEAQDILMDELSLLDIHASAGPLKKGAYNIRIIFDAEYYENEDIPDPYETDFGDMAVQHATVSMLSTMERKDNGTACPAVRKLCTELVLKGDIEAGKVRVFDWPAFCGGDTWTFVWRKKTAGNENGTGLESYTYYFLKITPDSRLHISHFNEYDLLESEEAEEVISYYQKKEDELRRHHKKYVEGLVYKDLSNKHIIARTCMYTMPDIKAIHDALYETERKTPLDSAFIINVLEAFCEEYPEYTAPAENVIEQIKEAEGPFTRLTRKTLKTMLGMRSKTGKAMNRFLHERYGIWVCPEFKDKDFDEQYMLTSMTDIGYFYEDNTSGEMGLRTFNYYAGIRNKDLNQSLHTPCIIREVRAEEDLEFESLLPLMAVDFVRVGKYTVLPFPFKYLREYARKHII